MDSRVKAVAIVMALVDGAPVHVDGCTKRNGYGMIVTVRPISSRAFIFTGILAWQNYSEECGDGTFSRRCRISGYGFFQITPVNQKRVCYKVDESMLPTILTT
ncbi:MAG: hypothetical protein ACLU4P_02790 [Ruminococcus sp.]